MKIEIFNSRVKNIIIIQSILCIVVAIIPLINISNKFNLFLSGSIFLVGVIYLFQSFKKIEILNGSISLNYLLRPFGAKKHLTLSKMKLLSLKIDDLRTLSIPTLTILTTQFPFIISIPINGMDDATTLIKEIKKKGNPKISANAFRLKQLEERLSVLKILIAF